MSMSNDANAPSPATEPLMPQWSLRSLMALTAVAAATMWVFRAAMVDGQFWARPLSIVLLSFGGCFFAYAVVFALASLFASLTHTIMAPLRPQSSPTATHAKSDATVGSDASGGQR